MSTKDLKRNPHIISDATWWYEETEGIFVVMEFREYYNSTRLSTKSVLIPWRSIEAATRRRRKK